MKIVHIFKDCYPPTTGGVEQHMNLLCRRLARNEDVSILAPSRSRRRFEERVDGVRIIRIPEFGRYASVPLCPTAPFELRRLLPDIVHVHFPNPMGDLTQLLGGSGIPFVVTYHADIIKQKVFVPLYRPVLNLFFNKASKVLFSAEENIPSLSFISANRHKCRVIPFGIEIDRLAPQGDEMDQISGLHREIGEPIVLFVGAARYYKGIDVILKAMAHVQGHLLLAGRGTDDLSWKKAAADLGVGNRVRFYGEVTQSRLRVLLHAADIFVLPSIDRCETFGIGQLEAMACSKPVISTDLPTGVRSVNRHGSTGLVVPPGDPGSLAGALKLLLSNPALCKEYGSAGRRRVEQEFGAERMVSKTLEVYHDVLSSPAGASAENTRSAEASI